MRDFIETKLKGASSSSWSDATTKRFFLPAVRGNSHSAASSRSLPNLDCQQSKEGNRAQYAFPDEASTLYPRRHPQHH